MANLDYPYMAGSMLALAKKIVDTNVPPVNKKYSTLLRDLVESMLEKEPQKRPTMFALMNSEFFFTVQNAAELLQTVRATYLGAKGQSHQAY